MRRAIVSVWLVASTVTLSFFALFIALFGERQETIHRIARLWARMYLAVAGIKVRTGDGWCLLRMSLHEPVMPLNVESDVLGGVSRIMEIIGTFLKNNEGLEF